MLTISIGRRVFGWSALRRRFCAQVENGKTLSDALLTCLRVSHATEETMCSFMEGQEWSLGGRIDAQHFRSMASEHLSQIKDLHRHHDAPISALVPLLRPAGFLFGAAVVHAPKSLRMAIYGALQDSVSDGYNDHIRTVLELQPAQREARLKELFVKLRDEIRVPEGATAPPDLQNLQRIEELSLSQGVGAAVKGTCRLTMHLLTKF